MIKGKVRELLILIIISILMFNFIGTNAVMGLSFDWR